MDLNLSDLLAELGPPERGTKETQFLVRIVPGAPAHYAGRDGFGFPCILLGSDDGAIRAPIRLAAIEARFAVPCQICIAVGEERQETLTVIVCTAPDPQLQRYFLHVCETIIRIVGQAHRFARSSMRSST